MRQTKLANQRNVWKAIFFLVAIFSIQGVYAFNLKISSSIDGFEPYNSYASDFLFRLDNNTNVGSDPYDFPAPSLPSNYSQLCSLVGGDCLSIDSSPSLPRTLNLLYNISDSINSNLILSWNLASGYSATLKDYGSDATYTTLIKSVNMATQNYYNRSTDSLKKIYFKLSISSGDSITLISPEPNTQSTSGVTRFIFQPASSSGITSCSLNYQGGTYLTTSNIQNNAQNVIEVVGINENHPLWSDDLQWYISCLTPSGTLTSETRHLKTKSDSGSTQHGGETGQGLNPKYIDIIYSSDWYIGQDYTIQVHAYNQAGELYDPANITFKGDSGFELTSLNSSIATFHVSSMQEGLHDLKVIVQDERTIENSISINVLSLQSASPEVKKAIPKIYTVIIIAGSLVFLALIVAIIIFEVYRQRRKAGK